MASLSGRTTPGLTPVPEALRTSIAEGPRDAATHAHWYAELACLAEVEVFQPPSPSRPESPARVLAWNVERGRNVPGLAGVIRAAAPQLVLATEMDVGMARSDNLHTPRALAEALGFGWVYGVEFVELGAGGPAEREACAGQANASGLHGAAILSAAPLQRPVVLRLEADAPWFLDEDRGEPRVGGRIAVIATWELGGTAVTVASVHLESHSDAALRARQMGTLLDALEDYAPGRPALVGGDLNTFSMGLEDVSDLARLRELLADDPQRFLHPVPHEPLFREAERRGYDWRGCNEVGTSTQRVASPAPSARGGLKLDWFLSRGLSCERPRVLEAADPDSGLLLSDHEPVAVTCSL